MRPISIIAVLLMVCASAAAGTEPTVRELEQEVAFYAEQVRQDAGDARALNALGFANHRLQKFDEALDAYTRAIAADPEYALPWNNVGAIRLVRHDYPGAEQMFRSALAKDPRYSKAAYNLAVALYRQGKYLKAYQAYRDAKNIDAAYVAKRMNGPESREKIDREIDSSPHREALRRELAKEQNANQ